MMAAITSTGKGDKSCFSLILLSLKLYTTGLSYWWTTARPEIHWSTEFNKTAQNRCSDISLLSLCPFLLLWLHVVICHLISNLETKRNNSWTPLICINPVCTASTYSSAFITHDCTRQLTTKYSVHKTWYWFFLFVLYKGKKGYQLPVHN